MFIHYPTMNYGGVDMVDITRRISIHNDIKTYDKIFQDYTIQDGQLPEHISFNFYGDANLHFIILLMNDIIDPFYGWVLSSNEFDKHVQDLYGANNLTSPHHWELKGEIVPSDTTLAVPVSNYTYEFEQNEKKRHIKILLPELVPSFVSEFKKAIRSEVR